MIRKGLTLIELIIMIVVIFIIGSIAFMALNGSGLGSKYYSTKGSGQYRCVKTYVTQKDDISYKRVDLQKIGSNTVETMECNDSWGAGVNNSAALYAQFEPGKTYNVSYVGYRSEGYFPYFPLVTSVNLVEK